jgi:uncharacterized protein (TIGR03437 family)
MRVLLSYMRSRSLPLLLLSLPLAAQDWPMYLRDLTHSSFNSAEKQLDRNQITNLQPDWTYAAGGTLASGATLSNGVLYFGDWKGNFHAVSAGNGARIWQQFVGTAAPAEMPSCLSGLGVSSQPTVIGNAVYVGGGDSAVYALDKSTGSRIWRVPLADPASGAYLWSSIMPYRNSLYIGVSSLDDCPLARGALARIDLANPQQPLIRYLMAPDAQGAGVWTTPAIDAATNTVFLNTGNGDEQDVAAGNYSEAFLALDATTLDIKSYFLLPPEESDGDLDWGSSPALLPPINGVPLALATGKDGVLYALRQSDLRLVWKTPLAVGCVDPVRGCGSLSTPAFDGSTVFVGAGVRDPEGFSLGSVYAINPATGSVIWVRDTEGPVVAPVTIANGLLFVSTTKGLQIYDTATGQFLWSDNRRGTIFSQPVVSDGTVFSTYVSGSLVAWRVPPSNSNTLSIFSAASGLAGIAPLAIVSAYGAGLEEATVMVRDSAGIERSAEVLYTSSAQINFIVPGLSIAGRAQVTVTTRSGATLSTAMQISDVAPGVFSANADGKGPAAAQAVLRRPDSSETVLSVFRCGEDPGSCDALPIDLGEPGDRVFLMLYGTGLRYRTALKNVRCTIGGVDAPVLYAGSQNDFEGLDQVNAEIPKSLAGRGQVSIVLSVDGQLANTVTMNIR